jgi:enoyl-[acyl-carrier protein] reductase/trans-2-enoyl-CoA reductase (NAD+)
VTCVAYSYVGPQVTRAVYRNGTIGKAKDHLEETTRRMDTWLQKNVGGRAFVSVNKALVTQSSSAIPFIPLYVVVLSKVMKEKGVEENCIMQMRRLFADRLYQGGQVPVDENGFIRMDDSEMRDDIQVEVARRWKLLTMETLGQLADVEGYHKDFLRLFGFGIPGVDYSADVDIG